MPDERDGEADEAEAEEEEGRVEEEEEEEDDMTSDVDTEVSLYELELEAEASAEDDEELVGADELASQSLTDAESLGLGVALAGYDDRGGPEALERVHRGEEADPDADADRVEMLDDGIEASLRDSEAEIEGIASDAEVVAEVDSLWAEEDEAEAEIEVALAVASDDCDVSVAEPDSL